MSLKFKVFQVNDKDKEFIPAEKDTNNHYYKNNNRRQARSPLGSEHEIESQLPQMKNIVMDPRTSETLNLSDHSDPVNHRLRLGTRYTFNSLATEGDADDFKTNLFNKFNQYKQDHLVSRNQKQIGESGKILGFKVYSCIHVIKS